MANSLNNEIILIQINMSLGLEVKIGFGLKFNPENRIGSGAFGEIYTGSSDKGVEIAIKIVL